MNDEDRKIYCEEIWITGNQRSDPRLTMHFTNNYRLALPIGARLDKHELAHELRQLALAIESNDNI